MSELVRLIDDYRATHGRPPDASIARMMGVAPQTINSWRQRGIKRLPARGTLEALADVLDLPYTDYVLQIALYDTGWRDDLPAAPNTLGRSVRKRLKPLEKYAEAEPEAEGDTPTSGSA